MLSLAVGLAVLVVAAAVISIPLLFQRLEPYHRPQAAAPEFDEQDTLLEALGELELSFQCGKLSPQDYEQQKALLEHAYIQLVEARESAAPAPPEP
ncbi:MAG TPA: hypothetical protein VL359_08520 [bacterium]|nr:hypothetical protein [bacterium]